ncbi:MAG: beta-ketoacyl-[acyl-carrier-protein] synthase family protein [Phycisphaerales bacterium]
MDRTVVISGLGTVCGLGIGIQSLWGGLCAGRTALGPITRFDPAGFPTRLGSEAREFSGARDWVPKSYRKAVKVMARDIELAVCAAKCAVEDAALVTRGVLPEDSTAATTYPGARMGCQIGAGLIAAEADELTAALVTASTPELGLDHHAWGSERGGQGAMNNLPPLWLLKYLPNMLACHVTIIHGAEGPSNTITCAEASGLLSIGESVRVIQRGDADLCFSGGAEAPINPMRLLRWEIIGRLAPTGDEQDGSKLVRPFDPKAPGSLLGEAGGIILLEDRDSAARRGAKVYAEVAGFGAAHSSPTDIVGGAALEIDDGFQFAIENALEDAGLTAADIDAIVPHALGVPSVDAGEAGALRAVFGARLSSIPLVTFSPNIGDALAGNGGLATAIAAKCLAEQRLPARVHAGAPAPGLLAGTAPSRPAILRHILVASGAIGGQNAALILRATRPAAS